jgi:hypothetical protein
MLTVQELQYCFSMILCVLNWKKLINISPRYEILTAKSMKMAAVWRV